MITWKAGVMFLSSAQSSYWDVWPW